MGAASWDILGKAADLAQLSGLHAAMLVALAMSLFWSPQSRQECARLELSAGELRALLQWPTGCLVVIQSTEMGHLVSKALDDADGLVKAYNESTLWHRVRNGRTMVAQFRGMQNRISSHRGLVLLINGHLLMHQMTPPSSGPYATIRQVNDPSHGVQVQAVAQRPTATGAELPQSVGIGQEGVGRQAGNTVDPGYEIVPDIVISHE